MQVAYLKEHLAAEFDLRAVTLIARDWTSLLKTSREKFIVPDRDLDAEAMAAMEREESGYGESERSGMVTGAPPRVVAVRVSALDPETGALPVFQQRVLAVHFMASRVLVPFVDCAAAEQECAHKGVEDLLCGTWAAHGSIEGVAKVRSALCTPRASPVMGRRGDRRCACSFASAAARAPRTRACVTCYACARQCATRCMARSRSGAA